MSDEATENEKESTRGLPWQAWLPAVIGFICAFVGEIVWEGYVNTKAPQTQWWVNNGTLVFSSLLLCCALGILSLRIEDNVTRRLKMAKGYVPTIVLSVAVILFYGMLCWPVLILLWILISAFWSNYQLVPERQGVWCGFGGIVALILGAILAYLWL